MHVKNNFPVHLSGLLIKQMLVQAKGDLRRHKLVDQTRGVVFYSTPHKGSPLAAYTNQAGYLILPSIEVKELEQGQC